jgi:hypothetical protein
MQDHIADAASRAVEHINHTHLGEPDYLGTHVVIVYRVNDQHSLHGTATSCICPDAVMKQCVEASLRAWPKDGPPGTSKKKRARHN